MGLAEDVALLTITLHLLAYRGSKESSLLKLKLGQKRNALLG